MGWDVFISHASEDKADVARPLADALKALGIKVWLDEWELKVGDSLRHKIDEGLADSRFGVVILSRNFFSKIWTKSELDALFCRDDNGQKVLLPVWHGVTKAEVTKFSPILAGLLAANFDEGIDVTVRKIIQGMGKNETNCLSSTEQNLKTWLSGRLIDTFNKDGIYQGHFGGCESWKEAQRWQLEKGGEVVDSPLAPKLPYFGTYWAYEAAFRLLPEKIACWTPVTRAAISRHFGSKRWLKVVREYSFHDGPLCVPKMYESIRHTARAAEVLHLLNPSDSEVSRIAWDLLDEAPLLQQEDGGWPEFRTCSQEASLWSTVYVYRFLSKLIAPDHPTPDEHHSFLKHVLPLLARMTEFLGEQWRRSNWTPNDKISWEVSRAMVIFHFNRGGAKVIFHPQGQGYLPV